MATAITLRAGKFATTPRVATAATTESTAVRWILISIALCFLAAFDRAIQSCHELSSRAERIEGTAFDQRFKHPFVQEPEVNLFAELK